MRTISRLHGRRGTRRANRAMQALLTPLVLLMCTLSVAQDVRIGVLGLFHSREIVVQAVPDSAVVLRAADRFMVLETSSGIDKLSLRLDGDVIAIQTQNGEMRSRSISLRSRNNGPADIVLTIPGKITRRYHGTLEVTPSSASLLMIVTMDLETAVASVVAAESDPDTLLEALKAQAIATRSYFVAGRGRHDGFDFCDTTHCQFLRTMPDSSTPAARAVVATRGLILAYNAQPFAAMYTRSCSGRTRTPAEIDLPANGYPYYAVECKHCREHPAVWQSRVTPQEAVRLRTFGESARLEIDRLLGWSTVPSNNFTVKRVGNRVLLEGLGEGHSIGLCQAGAAAMAREGATFARILAHYYPNTSVMKYVGRKW
jgi:stage II sporulation protein D (peptidoglycan lytic transglycosylase)